MNKILKSPFIKNTVTSCHIIPYDCGTIYVNFIDENETVYPRSFMLCENEYDER